MEPRISIITLGVADLERSCRFYRDGLGFPTTGQPESGIIFFQTTGACLALSPLDKLAEAGFDPVYGARPLKRAIRQYIENPLAQEILQGKFQAGDMIQVGVDDDRLDFQNAA